MFFECVMAAYMTLCGYEAKVDSCRQEFISCVAKELVSRDKVDKDTQLDTFNTCELKVFGKEVNKRGLRCY